MTHPHLASEVDDDVRLALAEALGERKVRLTDRRLLVLYLTVVALFVGLGFVVQQLVASCEDTRANTQAFNEFIDKVVTTTAASPTLEPAERRLRAEFFKTAKQDLPECPPGALSLGG